MPKFLTLTPPPTLPPLAEWSYNDSPRSDPPGAYDREYYILYSGDGTLADPYDVVTSATPTPYVLVEPGLPQDGKCTVLLRFSRQQFWAEAVRERITMQLWASPFLDTENGANPSNSFLSRYVSRWDIAGTLIDPAPQEQFFPITPIEIDRTPGAPVGSGEVDTGFVTQTYVYGEDFNVERIELVSLRNSPYLFPKVVIWLDDLVQPAGDFWTGFIETYEKLP